MIVIGQSRKEFFDKVILANKIIRKFWRNGK